MFENLEEILIKYEDINMELASPDVTSDQLTKSLVLTLIFIKTAPFNVKFIFTILLYQIL